MEWKLSDMGSKIIDLTGANIIACPELPSVLCQSIPATLHVCKTQLLFTVKICQHDSYQTFVLFVPDWRFSHIQHALLSVIELQ